MSKKEENIEEKNEKTTENVEGTSTTAEETKAPAVSEDKKEENVEEAKTTGKVKLTVLIAFTDKNTKTKYKVNDVIEVDEDRAKELLADKRKLVKE